MILKKIRTEKLMIISLKKKKKEKITHRLYKKFLKPLRKSCINDIF